MEYLYNSLFMFDATLTTYYYKLACESTFPRVSHSMISSSVCILHGSANCSKTSCNQTFAHFCMHHQQRWIHPSLLVPENMTIVVLQIQKNNTHIQATGNKQTSNMKFNGILSWIFVNVNQALSIIYLNWNRLQYFHFVISMHNYLQRQSFSYTFQLFIETSVVKSILTGLYPVVTAVSFI